MRKALVILAVSGALTGACGPDSPSATNRVQVPALRVSDAPDWTGATPDDFPVAHVGGVPVPASRFRRALDRAPDRDPRAVLEDLIDQEVAAQAAVREAQGTPSDAADRLVWERALVDALIDDLFMSGFREEDIPPEHLQELFAQPQIWGRFNHQRIFEVQDYQWICCDGRPRNCAAPHVQACFAEGAPAMAAVHEALLAAPPDSEDLPLLVERYQSSAPRLAYQEFLFTFDEERGIQRGRVVIDDAVVAQVVKTPVGQFAPPVRSRFGWHILYVRESIPPESRGLEDPTVRHEIATTFRARLQQMRFLEFLAPLVGTQSLVFLRLYFEDRPAPDSKPRYDVEVYHDTLQEAAEDAASLQEDKLL